MKNKYINNEKAANQGNVNIKKQINIYKHENSKYVNNSEEYATKSVNSEIIDLTVLNVTFPSLPKNLVSRDNYLNLIEKKLEVADILYVKGDYGVGITTILATFAKDKPYSVISHFLSSSFIRTYSPDFVIDNIARQIQFYSTKEITDDNVFITDESFSNLQRNLLKKIKIEERNGKKLYFIFDGFSELEKSDLENLRTLLQNLPFNFAKFIFSCEEVLLEGIIPQKIKKGSIDVPNFTLSETEIFLKDLTENKDYCREIHNLAHKGLPEKLTQIKRVISSEGIDNFLQTIDKNTDLFEIEWKDVQESDKLLIALIAFNNENYELNKISEIINISISDIKKIIIRIKFIEIVNNELIFISNSHRNYAKEKLIKFEEQVWSLIIEYYEKNKSNEESIFNLPNLYHKAKKWNELTKLLTLDAFISFVEKYQSISNVKRQIDYGLEAAKHLNTENKFVGEVLKFALHKSSFLEMEKFEMWESEVEARIALEQYDEAIILANKVLLKEDRLKMLSIIAKQLKILGRPIDNNLIIQIKELYIQVDFTDIKEKAIEISNYLIYFDFELAFDLLEKVLDKNTKNNSVDFAFAYLSLFAYNANKNANSRLVDIDLLNSKIKDEKSKALSEAIDFLSDEFNAIDIINKAKKLDNVSRKLFLLRYWISNNKKKENIENTIEFALNEIITASDENIPNASTLADISSPLPFITDYSVVEKLISLFDSQKNTINTPTRDFISLQLTIAEALNNFNISKTEDRIYEIWYLIDEEISDLSIKTDCLTLLWNKLLKIDINNSYEKSIYPTTSIENQISENINELLDKTAFHFSMVEFIIKTIVYKKPDFVFNIIQKLNTLERRDAGYKLATFQYINDNEINEIDFDIFEKFYSKINSNEDKDDSLINLIDKFIEIKDDAKPFINKLLRYKEDILNIKDIDNKCYALTNILKILNIENEKYNSLNGELYNKLVNTWKSIDNQIKKIEIGFFISHDLSSFQKEKAIEFIKYTNEYKVNEPLGSSSIMETYIYNAHLLIKSFQGTIKEKKNIDEKINKLEEIIEVIQSVGEKAKLWSFISLVLRANNYISEFMNIVKEKIEPQINQLNTLDKNYKISIFSKIAPSIFHYSESAFFQQIREFPTENKDKIIYNVFNYIFTKKYIEEPVEERETGVELLQTEYNQLIALIEQASDDSLLFMMVKKIAINLEKNVNRKISVEQRNRIIHELEKLIDIKLPNSLIGISHKGYWIVSKASLLIFYDFSRKKPDWVQLLNETRQIPNLSDKALVLILIAELMPKNAKKYKIDILEEAFNLIKTIPSNYDKTNRFDATWDIWLDIGKEEFCKHIKIAYNELLSNNDGTLNNLKNMIDVAHQHDSRLAEEMVTLLDQDQARKRLKEPLLKRLESKNRVKKASDELINLKNLSSSEYKEVFEKSLAHINSGRRSSVNIEKTYEILDIASKTPLSFAFSSLSFFIQNEIERKHSDFNLLNSFFEATYQNAKLIATFSADNVEKMKNLFRYTNLEHSIKNPIFRSGEGQNLFEYLSDWIYNNVSEEIIFIDPYFNENDLVLLKIISEVKADCFITILTSRKNKQNTGNNKSDKYSNAWNKISVNIPPQNRIIIVWDNEKNECPFHDRWLLSDNCTKGLVLNSINSNGSKRDTQINELDENALKNVERTVVMDYIYKRKTRVNEFNLEYEDFKLIR